MEISFGKVVSYYNSSSYPLLNQAVTINQKYQTFTKETAGPKGNLYLVEFLFEGKGDKTQWQVDGANFDSDSQQMIEVKTFFTVFKTSKMAEYLEKLGIQEDDFVYIYDYATISSWFKKTSDKEPIYTFSKPRTYLVFFDETTYNLLRLTHKNSDVILNFEPRVGYDSNDKSNII